MNLTLNLPTVGLPLPTRAAATDPDCDGPLDALDDAALMARYRDGDEGAFRSLYSRHRGTLYRYALRLAGDRNEADELFQDVWIAVIRGRDRYVPNARFVTYLFAIAHRRAADRWRRRFRDEARLGAPQDDVDRTDENSPEPASQDSMMAMPELETWNAQRAEALQAAVLKLPLLQREAFLLRAETGMSIDEIARVTATDPEAVKSRLRYATQRLRAALESWR